MKRRTTFSLLVLALMSAVPGAAASTTNATVGGGFQNTASGINKVITTGDLDGVALASIQGLYQIVQEQDAQLTQQQAQINRLAWRG